MILLSEYLDSKVQSCKKPVTACDRCTSLGLLSSLEDTKSQDNSRATQGLEQELELEFRSASELEPVYNQDQGQDQGQDVQQGEDYNTGPFLIQQYNRQTAQQLQQFLHRLNILQGSCILCRFLDKKRG